MVYGTTYCNQWDKSHWIMKSESHFCVQVRKDPTLPPTKIVFHLPELNCFLIWKNLCHWWELFRPVLHNVLFDLHFHHLAVMSIFLLLNCVYWYNLLLAIVQKIIKVPVSHHPINLNFHFPGLSPFVHSLHPRMREILWILINFNVNETFHSLDVCLK